MANVFSDLYSEVLNFILFTPVIDLAYKVKLSSLQHHFVNFGKNLLNKFLEILEIMSFTYSAVLFSFWQMAKFVTRYETVTITRTADRSAISRIAEFHKTRN